MRSSVAEQLTENPTSSGQQLSPVSFSIKVAGVEKSDLRSVFCVIVSGYVHVNDIRRLRHHDLGTKRLSESTVVNITLLPHGNASYDKEIVTGILKKDHART